MFLSKVNENDQQPNRKRSREHDQFKNVEIETDLKHVNLTQNKKNVDSNCNKILIFIHHIDQISKSFYTPVLPYILL